MKGVLVLSLLSLTLLAPGCSRLQNLFAPLYDVVVPTRRPEPAYEALFPYYAEVCAVTQYRRRDGVVGGVPGHAVMYLKGVCRDPEAPYPTLTACPPGQADDFTENHGVGISVNKIFKNVNWIAIPGKRLLLDGNLEPGARLTLEHYNEVLDEATASGIFRGIEVHQKYLAQKQPGHTLAQFVGERSIGTDFALRFARTVYCTRMPVTEPQMLRIMQYLNDLNAEYASGEADYDWSGYHDNCVHTLHNALAAAAVWKPKSVRIIKLRQFFHMAIPANAVVDLAALGNLEEIEDLRRIARDDVLRSALEEYDWLPMRHGVLMKSLPIHQENDLFDTKTRLLVVSKPFGGGTNRKANIMLRDARGTELEANLRWYRDRYEQILEKRDQARRPLFAGDDYEALELRYYAYIARQLDETRDMLGRLGELRDAMGQASGARRGGE